MFLSFVLSTSTELHIVSETKKHLKTSLLRVLQKQYMSPTGVPYLFEGCYHMQTMYIWMRGQIFFNTRKYCNFYAENQKLVCLKLNRSHAIKNTQTRINSVNHETKPTHLITTNKNFRFLS